MPTTPTPIRLTDADKVKLAEIQTRFGLPSLAAAVRYAIETTRLIMHAETVEIRVKKSKKGA
jgi:hypothetical protein